MTPMTPCDRRQNNDLAKSMDAEDVTKQKRFSQKKKKASMDAEYVTKKKEKEYGCRA